jgi:hypothetical protein
MCVGVTNALLFVFATSMKIKLFQIQKLKLFSKERILVNDFIAKEAWISGSRPGVGKLPSRARLWLFSGFYAALGSLLQLFM